MLTIHIPSGKYLDSNNMFVYTKECNLQLEHSLISISKWESKWQKPFMDDKRKTQEEMMDYIKCMTINTNVPDYAYLFLTQKDKKTISDYMLSQRSATKLKKNTKGKTRKQVVTSEIIYSWMVANNIPIECEKWHINRLMILIQICSSRNSPKKKMSKSELAEHNRRLNESRKAEWNTAG